MATNNFKFAQLQSFSLYGAGAVTGATTITLKSMTDIDGNALSMSSDFGLKGFGTLEPGNGTLEEQISFTGLVNNANGTVTLTGVSSVTFVFPYTETSGLLKTHAGSTTFVISNTSGFYNQQVSKDDDAVITGQYTFPGGGTANAPTSGVSYTAPTNDIEYASKKYVDTVAVAGAPNANTTTKGIVQLPTQAQVDAGTSTGSTGASLTPTPANLRSKLLSDYVADTGSANAYAIAPSPVISSYTTGQIFSFKAANTNTTTSTLNVNTLGVKTIKKASGNNLAAGDIIAGQVVLVEYDGTNFQLLNDVAPDAATQVGVQNNSYTYGGASAVGTDAYAVTITPAISVFQAGQVFMFKADVANTGAATLNINARGATPILKYGTLALNDNDIVVGQEVQVMYDGTNYQMLSPTAKTPLGIFTDGLTTKNAADSSTTQNIAHGLTVIPKSVSLLATIGSTIAGAPIYLSSQTTYNGTTQASLSFYAGATNSAVADTTFTINAANSAATQTGVVTFDATNIIITWTKTNSPTGTYNILWTAQA